MMTESKLRKSLRKAGGMTKAIKLDSDDIKKIIAEHFQVDTSRIIKAQYSYFVEVDDEDTK